LASFSLCCFISEFVVRGLEIAPNVHSIAPPDKKSAYQLSPNKVMGYEFKKNYRDDDSPDLSASFPYTNADGQRDVERTVERVQGKKRVILLGDSVVAGHGIRDLRDTISQQLESLLGPSYEVLNFGVGGYCTRSEVELLETKGLKYKPDAVILLFLENDFTNWSTQIDRYQRRRPWLDKLFISSSLFRLLALRCSATLP